MNMSVTSRTSFNTQISNIAFACVKTRVEMGFKPRNNINYIVSFLTTTFILVPHTDCGSRSKKKIYKICVRIFDLKGI